MAVVDWIFIQMGKWLTHWGRVTHICVGNLTIIGSDNGLSPSWRQSIIWINAAILLIGPIGTNLSEILIKICAFSFNKMHLKTSSGKWPPSCLCLNVLMRVPHDQAWSISHFEDQNSSNEIAQRPIHEIHRSGWRPIIFVVPSSIVWDVYGCLIFSCDQAALQMVFSVCLSVRPTVRRTFLTMFPSSYHHEIFRSYYQWQKWRPCKKSRSEVKDQGHRGHNPTLRFPDCNSSLNWRMMMKWCI